MVIEQRLYYQAESFHLKAKAYSKESELEVGERFYS